MTDGANKLRLILLFMKKERLYLNETFENVQSPIRYAGNHPK